MDLELAKKQFDKQLIFALSINNKSNKGIHPLRVIQALKSIAGINLNDDIERLLLWGDEFLYNFKDSEKYNSKFKFSELNETISLRSIKSSIKDCNYDLSYQNLEQLSRVSDGRPILEYFLELSLKQSGRSFLFIWTAMRTNLFLKNTKIVPILICCLESLLDDQFIASSNQTIFKSNTFAKFEFLCHASQIRLEDMVRGVFINKLLPDLGLFRNFDIYEKNDFFKIQGNGRKGILNYLLKIDKKEITPNLIILLDAVRTGLKANPSGLHNDIINIGNYFLKGLND